MNDDPSRFAKRTRTSKTKLVAWGLLAGLLVSTLVATRQQGRTLNLLMFITGTYTLLLPIFFSIKEGFPSANRVFDKAPGDHGVILFVPPSIIGQLTCLVALIALALSPEFLVNLAIVTSSQIVSVFSSFAVAAATFLPIAAAEVALLRKWGRTPPEGAFRALMSAACVAGFLIGFFRLFLIASGEDLHFLLLFLTPLVYGVYMSRYRTVRSWQKALELESDRADTAEHARQIAEMQLSLLQAQIEPHFLYNTLASVQYLVRKDRDSADFMLTQLIRYLRHAMPKMRSALSTLEQEFELADAYLQIASIRMGGRLTVVLDLPEHLRAFEFPPLIVQTLVENALKHGLEPKAGAVSIEVKATLINAQLNVMVSDTGVGLGKSISQGTGTGLINIRNRLSAIYPRRSNLSISAAGDGGVVALVTIETMPSEGSNT